MKSPKTESAMYTSMSDIGFNKNIIITKELREKINMDSQNNWKVRTETIDLIASQITDKMRDEPELVIG